MVELMADVGVKMSLLFMYYNPRFFLYVPLDVKGMDGSTREVKLVMSDESINPDIGPGFSLRDSEDQSLKYIGGPIESLAHFYQNTKVDWEHLDERLGIAVRSLASMKLHHSQKIDASMGENYSKDSMSIQKILEESLLEREDSSDHSVREDYLMKFTGVEEKKEETPKLSIVREEQDD